MNIQAVNNYTKSNIRNYSPSFKERDIVDDYVKTPYEQEMDNLYNETKNQVELLEYFHKDDPVRLAKEKESLFASAFKKRENIKTKYLKPKSFIKRLFKI